MNSDITEITDSIENLEELLKSLNKKQEKISISIDELRKEIENEQKLYRDAIDEELEQLHNNKSSIKTDDTPIIDVFTFNKEEIDKKIQEYSYNDDNQLETNDDSSLQNFTDVEQFKNNLKKYADILNSKQRTNNLLTKLKHNKIINGINKQIVELESNCNSKIINSLNYKEDSDIQFE